MCHALLLHSVRHTRFGMGICWACCAVACAASVPVSSHWSPADLPSSPPAADETLPACVSARPKHNVSMVREASRHCTTHLGFGRSVQHSTTLAQLAHLHRTDGCTNAPVGSLRKRSRYRQGQAQSAHTGVMAHLATNGSLSVHALSLDLSCLPSQHHSPPAVLVRWRVWAHGSAPPFSHVRPPPQRWCCRRRSPIHAYSRTRRQITWVLQKLQHQVQHLERHRTRSTGLVVTAADAFLVVTCSELQQEPDPATRTTVVMAVRDIVEYIRAKHAPGRAQELAKRRCHAFTQVQGPHPIKRCLP